MSPDTLSPPLEPSDEQSPADIRKTPEYRRARGSIFMVAFLFYGVLAFMCVVVALVVVILLTRS